jgi:hypothetical protein
MEYKLELYTLACQRDSEQEEVSGGDGSGGGVIDKVRSEMQAMPIRKGSTFHTTHDGWSTSLNSAPWHANGRVSKEEWAEAIQVAGGRN